MLGMGANSMYKKLTAALVASAILLPAATLGAGSEVPIKISGSEAPKGVQQIAIGAFNVGFIFESVDQTAATGGMIGAFGGATKAKSELAGVTPAMMQQITDAAYADFSQRLTSAGYTVVAPAQMFADPAMQKAKGQAGPVDIKIALEKGSKGQATFFKPTELPQLLMMPGDFVGSGLSSMALNMAAGMNSYAMSSYAKSAGVGVVDVVYLVDFSDQKRPGAFSLAGLKVNAALSITANYSRVSFIAPSGRQAIMTIKTPTTVEGEFITKDDATSGADKTMQVAANVAGGIAAGFGFGGMRFGKTRKFTFTAKPGNYEEGATKAASLTNERVVGQLQALR